MRIIDWWAQLSRAYQNSLVLFLFDTAVFLGALLEIRPLHLAWDALTWMVPNIFETIVLQGVALIRDVAPQAIVASPVLVVYGTLFLSLLCVHLVIGFGIGFLYDHTERTLWWSFANYFTLIAVLFIIHLFLLYTAIPVA